MTAQSIDELLRDELQQIARLQARGLSRYEALCRLDLEVSRDPGDHSDGAAFTRRAGPLRRAVGEREPVEESRRRTPGEGGDGEMLDPTWTPERGRSHVARLAELADGIQP